MGIPHRSPTQAAAEMKAFVLLISCGLAVGDFVGHDHSDGQLSRTGRQEGEVQGGIDFSGCEEDPETGLCCVDKEETVTTLKKDPILEYTVSVSVNSQAALLSCPVSSGFGQCGYPPYSGG